MDGPLYTGDLHLDLWEYYTISINLARDVICDALAEICTPAKSRMD